MCSSSSALEVVRKYDAEFRRLTSQQIYVTGIGHGNVFEAILEGVTGTKGQLSQAMHRHLEVVAANYEGWVAGLRWCVDWAVVEVDPVYVGLEA